jgi:hypothetical protein
MEVLSHGNFVLWEWFVHQGPGMLDRRIIENLLNLSGTLLTQQKCSLHIYSTFYNSARSRCFNLLIRNTFKIILPGVYFDKAFVYLLNSMLSVSGIFLNHLFLWLLNSHVRFDELLPVQGQIQKNGRALELHYLVLVRETDTTK